MIALGVHVWLSNPLNLPKTTARNLQEMQIIPVAPASSQSSRHEEADLASPSLLLQ